LEVIARCWRPRWARNEAGRDVGIGPCVVSCTLLTGGIRAGLGMRKGVTSITVLTWSPGRYSCWCPRWAQYEVGCDVGIGPSVVSWSLLVVGVRVGIGMRQGATSVAVLTWSPCVLPLSYSIGEVQVGMVSYTTWVRWFIQWWVQWLVW
jgi:hypothetical protein